jgi:hypothetical protein
MVELPGEDYMSGKAQQADQQKRISFDLRGENAEAFEEFRLALAKKLGFNISPSKVVLWTLNRLKNLESVEEGDRT